MKRCDTSSRSRYSLRVAAPRRLRPRRSARETARSPSTSSGTPAPVVATVFMIGGRHSPSAYVCSARFDSTADTRRSAPSRSALLTTKMSAISMMPALSAWTSSPVPGTSITIETSAVRTMSTSSWPTPTVSMMIDVLAGGVEHERRVAGRRGQPAEVAARRHAADEHALVARRAPASAGGRRGSRRR